LVADVGYLAYVQLRELAGAVPLSVVSPIVRHFCAPYLNAQIIRKSLPFKKLRKSQYFPPQLVVSFDLRRCSFDAKRMHHGRSGAFGLIYFDCLSNAEHA
jgi:hypothetical protein